ncbi:MAG: DUF3379 family protein [Steroidobacteraceae bacterium]
MSCEAARLRIGGEPGVSDEALRAHIAGCPSCGQLQREMQELDARIHRALHTQLPAADNVVALPAAAGALVRRPQWQRMALAATVLVAVLGAVVTFAIRPTPSLAAALAAHVAHEPTSWDERPRVDPRDLEAVLRRSDLHLSPDGASRVTYAMSCWFRGSFVAHLVVHTEEGPVTIMPLPGISVAGEEAFTEGDYSGVIVPVSHGSIAVIRRGSQPPADRTRQLLSALALDVG